VVYVYPNAWPQEYYARIGKYADRSANSTEKSDSCVGTSDMSNFSAIVWSQFYEAHAT